MLRDRKAVLVLVGIVSTILVGGLLFSGHFSGFATEKIVAHVRAWGPLGPLALIVLLIAQAVIAPLPSPPLLMAGGFIYGPWLGFAIGWVGLLLGATACFMLARALGRPFAERFIRRERLTAMDQYVGEQTARCSSSWCRCGFSSRRRSMR